MELDLDNIPIDDPARFELMGAGQTAGVFQVEGTRHDPLPDGDEAARTLDNVIAMVALYRPGPMEFIPNYIQRMHGEAEGGIPAPGAGADLSGDLRHPDLPGTD